MLTLFTRFSLRTIKTRPPKKKVPNKIFHYVNIFSFAISLKKLLLSKICLARYFYFVIVIRGEWVWSFDGKDEDLNLFRAYATLVGFIKGWYIFISHKDQFCNIEKKRNMTMRKWFYSLGKWQKFSSLASFSLNISKREFSLSLFDYATTC